MLYMLSNVERGAELKDRDVGSLVTEHIHWTKHLRCAKELMAGLTLPGKEQTVPKSEGGGCTEEKDISEETEEAKTYDIGINSA